MFIDIRFLMCFVHLCVAKCVCVCVSGGAVGYGGGNGVRVCSHVCVSRVMYVFCCLIHRSVVIVCERVCLLCIRLNVTSLCPDTKKDGALTNSSADALHRGNAHALGQ